jgi:alanyl-tRNA synthetase
MKAAEIRQKFLDYFADHGHAVRPSSSLVPADDPTLLFTNAGMVQFKRVFLGQEKVPYARAVTSQKCVRAGGKHNDLEEVGQTARHHTFFEMLGNFSFGDYFKHDAVRFAWELLTKVYGIDANRLVVTVHHTDDEAAALWADVVGVDPRRIYRLGDKDNFWAMAETGPCGPCSELHFDLRSESARRANPAPATADFEAMGSRGEFVELWNLVFMQYDRDAQGNLTPLPAPSIDTGAGLERVSAVLQGVESNFHTDLFRPLLDTVADVVGRPYDKRLDESVSYRVLADHARAVGFLLADGVFPSNEGRGYVLRRILRRAVRHAWVLGLREPALVKVVDTVVDVMGSTYPELVQRREHLLRTTRAEEERFLTTIEAGLARFEEIAPAGRTGVISGEEAFKLYDTFGFPLDLTELMARERGYTVDAAGFERSLGEQRARSRADRARSGRGTLGSESVDGWVYMRADAEQEFVGYQTTEAETELLALARSDDRVGLQLRHNPFYSEAGGQVSDVGEVRGEGWAVAVDQVKKVGGRVAVFGSLDGDVPDGLVDARLPVEARVAAERRHDTERNHTATHLLHAALRSVLGTHVVQKGSLVAPDRLRFDFAHSAPMTEREISAVESIVNEGIWKDHDVRTHQLSYRDALARGAMALFGEKYGDVVRMVEVPNVSRELCGGTHVRHTGEIGLFTVVSEGGVAAGVRRIEAQTGPGAFRHFRALEQRLATVADVLRTSPENAAHRAEQVLSEKKELEQLLEEVRRSGAGGGEELVRETDIPLASGKVFTYRAARLRARDADDARVWGDAFLSSGRSGVAVLAAELPGDKQSLFAFVTDDLVGRGVRADALIREVAAHAGGRGGGRPHMAQAGVAHPEKVGEALASAEAIVRRMAASA